MKKEWKNLEAHIEIYVDGVKKKCVVVGGEFTDKSIDVEQITEDMSTPILGLLAEDFVQG